MKNKKNSLIRYISLRRGFTFPEIMISLVVFAIAFIPIFGMFSYSNRASVMSRHRSLGEKLLIEKLEEFKHLPFNILVYEDPVNYEGCFFETGDTSRDSVILVEEGNFSGTGPGGFDYPPEYARYDYEVYVRPVLWNDESLDMIEVEVVITWLSNSAKEESRASIRNATLVRRLGTTAGN